MIFFGLELVANQCLFSHYVTAKPQKALKQVRSHTGRRNLIFIGLGYVMKTNSFSHFVTAVNN